MARPIRWGILGPGSIAKKFATGLQSVDDAEFQAVGSRSMDRAKQFAEEFDAARAHGSYEDLAADTDVDAIYIATPHPMHSDHAILCLRAGKAVLCEKPFTVNASQARDVIAAAREAGVFCMEAMWTRFLPPIVKLRELLAEQAIGELRLVMADFGFRGPADASSRLMNPDLAGGGLLDVGVYPISLACMALGKPEQIASLAHIGNTGIDEQAGAVLRFDGGAMAMVTSAVRTTTPHEAVFCGTEGQIRLAAGWWHGSEMTLRAGDREETFPAEIVGNGYNYQVEEVHRCLAEGRTESETLPLEESLMIMETLDTIRAQWPLTYPFE